MGSVFDIPRVTRHPRDIDGFDWKKSFGAVAGNIRRTGDSFISYNAGKFLGILLYTEELENENKKLKEESETLTEKISALEKELDQHKTALLVKKGMEEENIAASDSTEAPKRRKKK